MKRKIAVVGLGYVGLPVAVAFGKSHQVIGFDINAKRIKELKSGHDSTDEVTSQELLQTDIQFTDDLDDLRTADFFIIAVPTPVDNANKPDLSPLIGASQSVGKALKPGDIVVYESTVYPGATEEDCVPVLEKTSNLKYGTEFTVGYSPERINPGDREHTFTKIKKIVAGSDLQTLDIVAEVYGSVVTAGVHRAQPEGRRLLTTQTRGRHPAPDRRRHSRTSAAPWSRPTFAARRCNWSGTWRRCI